MLTRTINYTNLDGENMTEIAMFNINKMDKIRFLNKHPDIEAEVAELQAKANELAPKLEGENIDKETVNDMNQVISRMIKIIEDIVRASYGVRQGNKFNREPAVIEGFLDSEAYDELVANLIVDHDELKAFMSELFPDADFNS